MHYEQHDGNDPTQRGGGGLRRLGVVRHRKILPSPVLSCTKSGNMADTYYRPLILKATSHRNAFNL